MQIKNKLFPYPVLNHNTAFSNYISKSFELVFEEASTEDKLLLNNVGYRTNSKILKSLIDAKKVAVVLIIESTNSIFRKSYNITNSDINISMSNQSLSGKIELSIFAYALEDFEYCVNDEEIDKDYRNLSFKIEKYDILAADDGVSKNIIHKDSEKNLVKSIFAIQPSSNLEDGLFDIQYENSKKILINLSENDHKNYNIVYSMPVFQEVFFSMILIPALSMALTHCFNDIKSGTDIDDIVLNYQWFASIQKQYKRLKGVDLTKEVIDNINQPIVFAQELMGKPLKLALEKLIENTKKMNVEEE